MNLSLNVGDQVDKEIEEKLAGEIKKVRMRRASMSLKNLEKKKHQEELNSKLSTEDEEVCLVMRLSIIFYLFM